MSGEVTFVEPLAPEPGATVGPWLLLESWDGGSYGLVYLARRADQPQAPAVALKMARNPRDARFEREVAALKALGLVTSHVPRLEDAGVWKGPSGHRYPYVVMEFVEGLSLYDWHRDQPRSSRQVLRVLAHVASALAAAHARGIVHRDAKGGNIVVQDDGRAVLLDWGACWLPEARPLTDTPAPPGTPAYRPPEQKAFLWTCRRDREARWHSTATDDLYAVGVALYRLVTGMYLPPCTEGGRPVEREVLKPGVLATVCLELETLILRLLSDQREARGTAEQLAREAQALADTAGPEADQPILPKVRRVETDEPSEPSGLSDTQAALTRRSTDTLRQRLAWLGWGGAGMASGLVLALLLVGAVDFPRTHQPPGPAPWLATPEELAQFAEAPPSSADAGVAEEVFASAEAIPKAVLPAHLSLGRPMPPKPFPGQRRPPCVRGEREIRGGCWLGPMEGQQPPCGDRMFDYEGKCYFASYDQARQPASEEP